MSNRQTQNWVRSSLLLLAFAGGTVTTRFTSEFNEMALKPYDSSEPRATAKRDSEHSSDVTGIDVDFRHLRFVGSIT